MQKQQKHKGSYAVKIIKSPYSGKRFDYLRYSGFYQTRKNKYSIHYERKNVSAEKADLLSQQAKNDKYKCSITDMKYQRSTNYRNDFLKSHPPPWRCRYCNRKIKNESSLQIDHIVPVAAATSKKFFKRKFSRWMLNRVGATSINDAVNLAPACESCNKHKAAKVGLWTIRGYLGAYKSYWIVVKLCLIIMILCVIFIIVFCFPASLLTIRKF